MASINSSEIFLLSLAFQDYFDEIYSSLIDQIHKSAHLKRAKTAGAAIRYFEASNPRAVLVTDQGLTQAKNRAVLDRVVSYIHDGGLVIVGLHFPNFTRMDVFDRFFGEAFGLPWKSGDYHRTDFMFNRACSLPPGAASDTFPAPYSMKALHIKNAQPHEKIFVPIANALTQSIVFPAGSVDQAQAAVVGAKLGEGYLVYIGDVNAEDESSRVIMSLCGL